MMAGDLVLLLLKLNLAASAAILLVLALRAPMRRIFGARIAYTLWLIVPVAAFAVLLPARTVPIPASAATFSAMPPAAEPTAFAGSIAEPISMSVPVDPSSLIASIWLIGAIAALVLLTFRQRIFIASLGRLSRERRKPRIFRAEASGIGPALIGSLFPKLILPSDFETRFDETERDIVLAHEAVHLRGRDPLINAFVALAQCLNWFNPLMHIAARTLRIDQELACDAAVIARFPNAKRSYAEAMLKTQLAPASLPLGCYWPARGEHPLKQRIAMLKRELPGRRRVVAGAVLAALACLSTGCVIWVVQPPREVEALASSASPEQATLNERLLRAVWTGNARRAEAALASGADANVRTRDGTTALVISARAEDMRILNLLLDHGADPNLTSPGEGNALVAAARRDHVRAAAALIEHGAEVNTIAPGVGTPLAAAARAEQFRTVKYLVEHGADVNLRSPLQAPWDRLRGPRAPLEFAIGSGHAPIVAYLKSKGARM